MSGNHSNRARLSLESLDRRDVPSATAAFQGQLLVITGDAGKDVVVVQDVGDKVQVTVNGQSLPLIPHSSLQGVVFLGGDGDDVFVNASSVMGIAAGGKGDDVLLGLSKSTNLFDGNEGNDTLVGGSGDDYLLGSSGDDVLYGGQGHDVVSGGEGHDHEVGGHDANDLFDDRGTDPNDVFDDHGGNSNGGTSNQAGDSQHGQGGKG